MSWRSESPLPLDLNGPRDVAFRRFEQAWIRRPAIELFADIALRYPDAVACRDRDTSVSFSGYSAGGDVAYAALSLLVAAGCLPYSTPMQAGS